MRARSIAGLAALAIAALAVGCSSGGDAGGGMTAPPSTVTLLDVQSQVFAPSCALSECHVAEDPPFGLDLSSATASRDTAVGIASAELPAYLRVDPGNPADSYLFMKVTEDPRIVGDPMPAIGGRLSDADVELLRSWILDGAR